MILDHSILLLAVLPNVSWNDFGVVLVCIMAVIAGIAGVLRVRDWFDSHYVTRHEFEQQVADSARNEKLLDKIVELLKK